MLDIDFIRKNKTMVQASLARRGYAFDVEQFERLDLARKTRQQAAETLFAAQNANADEVGAAKRQKLDATSLIQNGESLRASADTARHELDLASGALSAFLSEVPNLPLSEVPDGKGEQDNQVLRCVGEISAPAFKMRTHDDLGVALKGLDFDTASSMSGARFVISHGAVARLHRALIQFMIDTHVDDHGYHEVEVPFLVKASALEGTGQLPKFEEDLFKLERDGLYLIPTAEVPVTNLMANQVIRHDTLPVGFVAQTPCFRREAGSAGRDVKGLIRQHQFQKVELVRFCSAEQAAEQFDAILSHAETILKKLELPYRVMSLCASDMGFSSEKTIDLEVWLPGQAAWREISSVSRFGTFQSRRMKARYKDSSGKNQLLHTLNGSGLAAGRTLVAVLENYQMADGSVAVPAVLQPYLKGMKIIKSTDCQL